MNSTGKSFSEGLILASTNPQLFIELWVQYMKVASSEHVVYKNCLLFYCGLDDARISASEKNLPLLFMV